MTERTKEEIAEIVFKGIGGEENKNAYWTQLTGGSTWRIKYIDNSIIKPDNKFPQELVDFIYSWPYPNCLGLIIEKAKEMGWAYSQRGFYSYFDKINLNPDEEEVQTKWFKDNNNPMLAVCKAFVEVLEREGKV